MKVVYKATVMEGCGDYYTASSEKEVEYKPVGVMKREYVCPRAIFVHKKPSDCGKECEKKRVTDGYEYVNVGVIQTMVITKEIVFDGDMCLKDRVPI